MQSVNHSNNILEVRNLKKGYKNVEVLKDVSFKMGYGKILGLLGRNGAGKTTMLKTILGLNVLYQGEILFEGVKLDPRNVSMMHQIGSLVDVSFFEDLTAYENLKIIMMITPGIEKSQISGRIDELLEFVDMTKAKEKKVKTFSFGMKQRLALAQALISEPYFLILDEPFVGLDPIGIEETKVILKKLCQEKNTSIIFSSHQLDEVKDLADDIMILSDGKIKLYDSYKNIKDQNQSLLELLR